VCNGKYSADDCAGQILRWQAIINSNGGSNLTWYYWNTAIGMYPTMPQNQNETAYYWMMQYLMGGHFTAACYLNGETWTCPFTEANGPTPALFVWAPSGNVSYNASGWVDYRDLTGVTTRIDPTNPYITIGVEPFMLEGPPTNQ
jgi:hypothetical protein